MSQRGYLRTAFISLIPSESTNKLCEKEDKEKLQSAEGSVFPNTFLVPESIFKVAPSSVHYHVKTPFKNNENLLSNIVKGCNHICSQNYAKQKKVHFMSAKVVALWGSIHHLPTYTITFSYLEE